MKRSQYAVFWMLGLVAGAACILFALLSGLGYAPEILAKPIKSLTGMVSAGILGIMGFLILGAARMTKTGGHRATTGGVFMLIFGFVAYLAGGAIGATLALLTGLIVVISRYV